jgi:hypothetical protein
MAPFAFPYAAQSCRWLKFRLALPIHKNMRASDKSLRIQKLIAKHPEMTDAQIARKIGMDSPEGRARVAKERPKQEKGELQ